MEYFESQSTGLRISRIGFGCASLSGYDYGPVNERDSTAAIQKAWDIGVNLFDTASVYGFGRGEELLAKALGETRHSAIIVTKFGVNWDKTGAVFRDSSVKGMLASLEASLRRLRIDCIPIYMIHWHDGVTPIAELMTALGRCRKEGKIRHIGCSNLSMQMVSEAAQTEALEFIQLPFSFIRTEFETQLQVSRRSLRTTTMAYDVLARGLLSGKYDGSIRFGSNDSRSRDKYFSDLNLDSNLQAVERLRTIALRYGRTPAEIAIRWVLERPAIDCALVGSKRVAQVIENTNVFGWSLSAEDQKILGESCRE